MEAVHIDRAWAPPGITDDSPSLGCCWGDVLDGPTRCTCWEPVFDLEQKVLDNGGRVPPKDEIPTRSKCCHDCAYRNGSPERERGEGEELLDHARATYREFWCHQGVRRIVAWEHPDGRRVEEPPGCYAPPQGPPERPVVWKADGSVGERCAGWAAHRGAQA